MRPAQEFHLQLFTNLYALRDCSTEGNTIICACSIPILQPLLDIAQKRNPLRSRSIGKTADKQQYENYSQPSELVTFGRGGISNYKQKKVGLTIPGDDESQETILAPQQHPNTGIAGEHTVEISGPRDAHVPGFDCVGSTNGIRKTQGFTVSYSSGR